MILEPLQYALDSLRNTRSWTKNFEQKLGEILTIVLKEVISRPLPDDIRRCGLTFAIKFNHLLTQSRSVS